MSRSAQPSEISIHEGGGFTLIGPDAIGMYRAMVLASSLSLYAKHGIKPTRGVTGPMMLKMATQYTGKTYKRGQYEAAAEDVKLWARTMRGALPVTGKGERA